MDKRKSHLQGTGENLCAKASCKIHRSVDPLIDPRFDELRVTERRVVRHLNRVKERLAGSRLVKLRNYCMKLIQKDEQ